jgi:hypothetical protein
MSNFGSSFEIGIGPNLRIEMDPHLVLELEPIFLKIMLFGGKDIGIRI